MSDNSIISIHNYLRFTDKSVIIFLFNMHNEFIAPFYSRFSCRLYLGDGYLPLEFYNIYQIRIDLSIISYISSLG